MTPYTNLMQLHAHVVCKLLCELALLCPAFCTPHCKSVTLTTLANLSLHCEHVGPLCAFM